MTKGNDATTLDWNGDTGRRWVAHQQRLDRMLAAYGDAALAVATPRRRRANGCWTSAATQA